MKATEIETGGKPVNNRWQTGGWTVRRLVDEAVAAGIDVRIDAGKLHVRGPRHAADLGMDLIDRKAEVLALLAAAACITCGRALTEKRQCWKCHDRDCSKCGRLTGSAFIAHCIACGQFIPDDHPEGP